MSFFTWDRPEAERLARAWSAHYDDVRIGGPAYGDLGDEFTPGRYLKLGSLGTRAAIGRQRMERVPELTNIAAVGRACLGS